MLFEIKGARALLNEGTGLMVVKSVFNHVVDVAHLVPPCKSLADTRYTHEIVEYYRRELLGDICSFNEGQIAYDPEWLAQRRGARARRIAQIAMMVG